MKAQKLAELKAKREGKRKAPVQEVSEDDKDEDEDDKGLRAASRKAKERAAVKAKREGKRKALVQEVSEDDEDERDSEDEHEDDGLQAALQEYKNTHDYKSGGEPSKDAEEQSPADFEEMDINIPVPDKMVMHSEAPNAVSQAEIREAVPSKVQKNARLAWLYGISSLPWWKTIVDYVDHTPVSIVVYCT